MNESPTRRIFDMMIAFGASQSIYAATKLGLPEHIAAGYTTSRELAGVTSTHQQSLVQLLRLLVDLGVLRGNDDAGFSLTSAGALLQEDAPGSLRDLVLIFGEEFYQAWGNLVHNIESGRPAFDITFGDSMYSYFAKHQDSGRNFDRAMNNGYFFDDVPKVVDFSATKTVVDVAGGSGGLLCEILRSNPGIQGVLFDQQRVIDSAKDLVASQGLMERVSFAAGDFGERIPPGGDCYVLSRILHSQDDESGVRLLKRCRDAMGKDGMLVIVERPVAPEGTTSLGVWSSVHMMVLVGGTERSKPEYLDLLHRSGFALDAIHHIGMDFVAMVARPAR